MLFFFYHRAKKEYFLKIRIPKHPPSPQILAEFIQSNASELIISRTSKYFLKSYDTISSLLDERMLYICNWIFKRIRKSQSFEDWDRSKKWCYLTKRVHEEYGRGINENLLYIKAWWWMKIVRKELKTWKQRLLIIFIKFMQRERELFVKHSSCCM